jgi:hypothetical protein
MFPPTRLHGRIIKKFLFWKVHSSEDPSYGVLHSSLISWTDYSHRRWEACGTVAPPSNYFSFRDATAPGGLLIMRLHDDTQTHHTRYASSGWVISPTQRPLTAQNTHNRLSWPHGSIRTRKASTQTASDSRLKPRCHRDRCLTIYHVWIRNKHFNWQPITVQCDVTYKVTFELFSIK